MNREHILLTIINSIKEIKPEHEDRTFSGSDSMADDLGADSVERSEIIMMTLQELDLRIPLVETYGPKNIGELAELLALKMQA